jgi:hypothetical protein
MVDEKEIEQNITIPKKNNRNIVDGENRYEHIAVKPKTFKEFRSLKKDAKSDNAFVLELLKCYKEKQNV